MATKAANGGRSRSTQRREQLLSVAALLFQESGYNSVSMDDIASAVGISGPALYRHFRNKHDVLVQALNEQLSSVEGVAAAAEAASEDPEERLGEYLRRLSELVIGRDEVLLWKRERTHLTGAEQVEFRQRLRDVSNHTVAMIRAWRPALSAEDAELLSWVVLGIFSNIRVYRPGVEREVMAEWLLRMSWAALSCDLAEAPPCPDRKARGYEPPPEARRERVLEAATVLFTRSSYHAVSVEQIAEQAEMALATVYQLYPSKAEILSAILTRGAIGTWYLTSHRLAMAADETAIQTVVDVYIELACGVHGRLLRILVRDAVSLPKEASEVFRRNQREYVEEWVRGLMVTRPTLSRGEAEALAHGTIGFINEVSQMASMQRRPNLEGDLRVLAAAILDA